MPGTGWEDYLLWEAKRQNFGEDGEKEEGKKKRIPHSFSGAFIVQSWEGVNIPRMRNEPKGFKVDSE